MRPLEEMEKESPVSQRKEAVWRIGFSKPLMVQDHGQRPTRQMDTPKKPVTPATSMPKGI